MLKFSHAAVLSSITLFGLACCLLPARAAQTEISTASVLACDTPTEIEAFLASSDNNIAARLVTVNDRFGKLSCNVATVAFYREDEAKAVLVPAGIVHIIKVNVIGVRTGDGWVRVGKPMPQYIGELDKATMV